MTRESDKKIAAVGRAGMPATPANEADKNVCSTDSAKRPADVQRSPLDVGFVPVSLSREEVVRAVREGRER